MSAVINNDSMAMATSTVDSDPTNQIELELANCECCGLKEECTPAYIATVRESYNGRWICGLCSEAVNYQIHRSTRLITTEEAVNRHVSFCKEFRSSHPPPVIDLAQHFIASVRQIIRRSLDSPRAVRSARKLGRSESCFPALAG